jgi:hypothetical protein
MGGLLPPSFSFCEIQFFEDPLVTLVAYILCYTCHNTGEKVTMFLCRYPHLIRRLTSLILSKKTTMPLCRR